jgi:hypothetical protein
MRWCFIRIRIPELDPYLLGAFIFIRIGISLCVLAGLGRCQFKFLLFFVDRFAMLEEEEEETVHG